MSNPDLKPVPPGGPTYLHGPTETFVRVIGLSIAHPGYYWCTDVAPPHAENLHYGEELLLRTPEDGPGTV